MRLHSTVGIAVAAAALLLTFSCAFAAAADDASRPAHLFVEVLDASDPFEKSWDSAPSLSVRVRVLDGNDKAPTSCTEGKFGTRDDTGRPAWRATKMICREYPEDTTDTRLRVTLHNRDPVASRDIGHADVALSDVTPGKVVTLRVGQDSAVVRIRVRGRYPARLTKRVYFVRNGETKYLTPRQRELLAKQTRGRSMSDAFFYSLYMTWLLNGGPAKATTPTSDGPKTHWDPVRKYYFKDYPVNVRGRNQALALADRVAAVRADATRGTEDERSFATATRVLASPMASAVLTATIGLSPLLQNGTRLHLKRDARERRQGIEYSGSEDVVERASAYMREHLLVSDPSAVLPPEAQSVNQSIWAAMGGVDDAEARGRWWHSSDESWEALRSRLYQFFVEQMLWEDDDDVILVGHAKFFRAFLQAQMQSQLKKRIDACRKDDAAAPGCERYKGYTTKQFMDVDMNYCAVMAVDVDFSSVVERAENPKSHNDVAIVADVGLLFGTGLWHN